MKAKAQIIAIAEICGWRYIQEQSLESHKLIGYAKTKDSFEYVPDYLDDLNAIQGAIMSLNTNQRDLLNLKLAEITEVHFDYSDIDSFDRLINATAAQRAEAFLKTLGKWTE